LEFGLALRRFPEQRFEQYTTESQLSFHFARQANGRSHTGQTLVGRSDFFTVDRPVGGVGNVVGLQRSNTTPLGHKNAIWIMFSRLFS